MKSRNVKVIDEHNIDRAANVMFALDLEGSEYVVYWIVRDEESNNVFVSKVLKNIDGTYNMINIDDLDKKEEVAGIVKTLISSAVSDQNDKMVGTTLTLANGKVAKFIEVSFNKDQYINVQKTYITTVKKEVTKVAESYYDVIVEESKVEDVLPSVTPVVEPVQEIFPEPVVPTVVSEPVVSPVLETPVLSTPTVEVAPVAPAPEVVAPTIPQAAPTVVEPITVAQPTVTPAPVVSETVELAAVIPTPVVPEPVVSPVVETPVVAVPAPEVAQPLVFSAAKETNLNAALGEVANSTTIPVDNIAPVREFGVEEPVTQTVPQQPVVAPATQPIDSTANASNGTPVSPKAGFANSKFFMVVAIAFFLASCVFLGYEVYNYFQLVQ